MNHIDFFNFHLIYMEILLNQIFSYALYLYNNYPLISGIFLNCIWTIILYLMLLKNLKC